MTNPAIQPTVKFEPVLAAEFPFAVFDADYLRQLSDMFSSTKAASTLNDDDHDSLN